MFGGEKELPPKIAQLAAEIAEMQKKLRMLQSQGLAQVAAGALDDPWKAAQSGNLYSLAAVVTQEAAKAETSEHQGNGSGIIDTVKNIAAWLSSFGVKEKIAQPIISRKEILAADKVLGKMLVDSVVASNIAEQNLGGLRVAAALPYDDNITLYQKGRKVPIDKGLV